MKFHPILFSTPMVQAIIQGNKTQTRRVVKPQPKNQDYTPRSFTDYFGNQFWEFRKSPIEVETKTWECPYGQVGDVLWVRESYLKPPQNITQKMLDDGADTWPSFDHVADCELGDIEQYKEWGWKVKPSIHMPKEACRLFLKITDIRVERLQDISEEDAIAEGVEPVGFDQKSQRVTRYRGYPIDQGYFYNARESFATLWQSINGKDSWNSNPWVWVISFERIEKPENFI